jgi:hypothetical protein
VLKIYEKICDLNNRKPPRYSRMFCLAKIHTCSTIDEAIKVYSQTASGTSSYILLEKNENDRLFRIEIVLNVTTNVVLKTLYKRLIFMLS